MENTPITTKPDPELSPTGSTSTLPRVSSLSIAFKITSYLVRKLVFIAVTIFVGIFLTILLVNRPVTLGARSIGPQLDTGLRRQIEVTLDFYIRDAPGFSALSDADQEALVENLRSKLVKDTGINLPYLPRHLLWTINALKFNWGNLREIGIGTPPMFWFGRENAVKINDIILKHLPSTMALVAFANFFLFLLGLPLAMWLSQHYSSRMDRVLTLLAPIFSIPSWVIGIFLIAIFAAGLRILPFGGMLDTLPPARPAGYILIVARHLVLPVLSIFLSLFFQLVYTWRTYFLIYSEEDYVDLGKAMGLPPRRLQQQYILKPAFTYILTSFSMILVTFWQMVMALEVIFNWPGVGWLFIKVGLPNFWGESMYPGEMIIAVSIIVIFAYVLGAVVFLLDILYVLFDPRLRVGENMPSITQRKSWRIQRLRLFSPKPITRLLFQNARFPKQLSKPRVQIDLKGVFSEAITKIRLALVQIFRYPSAVFGMLIILFMTAGSIYAVTAMSYSKIGAEWMGSSLTGQPLVPKLARPQWFNLFRVRKSLSTLILDSTKGEADYQAGDFNGDLRPITITFDFNYPYGDFPSESLLYLDSKYTGKRSFTSVKWITPDGREFNLANTAVGSGTTYNFAENVHIQRAFNDNPKFQEWFVYGQVFPTPTQFLLFADPQADEPKVLPGHYIVRLEGFAFEEASDIRARLVLLGHVYGLAGTDNLRREISTPLLWGMPIALGFGLLGALATTLLSMLLAAAGVWVGRWLDQLIQRLTEVNLILPGLAISVLAYAYLNVDLWVILGAMVLLNVFGSPIKNFRSSFIALKDSPYIEAAQAYGASSVRIIFKYLVPRIIPTVIPQLIVLIPSFVFLEVTLGLFNINTGYPTWGALIYQALTQGALYHDQYRLIEPLALVLLTGIAFSLFGFSLEKILNPRLQNE